MNIRKLAYFIAVANNLSFTKAAQECHIAQTAMSRQITQLEEELGVKLFERDNRHVSLTEEGKDFYGHATHIVEIYREAVDQMDMAANRRRQNLRIGIGPYESILLLPFLKDFNSNFPQVNFSCLQFNYEQLSSRLVDGTIDVMFCIDHCADRAGNVKRFTIYDGPWGIISAFNHRFADREEVCHRDLSGETVVTMSEYNFYDYKKRLEGMDSNPAGFIRVNTYTAKALFVQAGFGVAFVPKFVKPSLYKELNFALLPSDEAYLSSFVCAWFPEKDNKFFNSFIKHIRNQSELLKGSEFY
ncbi:MAG: LysR family transcriptional regulator [Synergistaceae bacterium]|jgi:DNA-binding transcriptional LysR family regulator|nr:LysR family transcriptional regulator [Synergistaceae bacterium]